MDKDRQWRELEELRDYLWKCGVSVTRSRKGVRPSVFHFTIEADGKHLCSVFVAPSSPLEEEIDAIHTFMEHL